MENWILKKKSQDWKNEHKMKIMREVNDSVFPTINLVNIPIL